MLNTYIRLVCKTCPWSDASTIRQKLYLLYSIDSNTCISNVYFYTAAVTYIYLSPTTFYFFFLLWRCDPTRVMATSSLRFLDHTLRRTTVGRTPLDEWSARRRDLYLTTHDTHNRQISMPPVGFEPMISVGERPQTYALDRAPTGTGNYKQIQK
jgi:hypothetical protein